MLRRLLLLRTLAVNVRYIMAWPCASQQNAVASSTCEARTRETGPSCSNVPGRAGHADRDRKGGGGPTARSRPAASPPFGTSPVTAPPAPPTGEGGAFVIACQAARPPSQVPAAAAFAEPWLRRPACLSPPRDGRWLVPPPPRVGCPCLWTRRAAPGPKDYGAGDDKSASDVGVVRGKEAVDVDSAVLGGKKALGVGLG